MKYLIMHGSYTLVDNPKYWFLWLKNQLEKMGHTVIAKQFPTEDWKDVNELDASQSSTFVSKQSLKSWEDKFVTEIVSAIGNEPFVFIGHSISPIFMLHMLQKYDFNLRGAVFVSPFFNIPDRPEIWQFYPTNKTFYNYEFDFDKIKSQILGKSYVVTSDNDPYVPASEPPLFAEKLGSEVVLVPGGKHCGSNFPEFPLLLDLANKIVS